MNGCRSGMDCPNIITCENLKTQLARELKDNNELRKSSMKLFKIKEHIAAKSNMTWEELKAIVDE